MADEVRTEARAIQVTAAQMRMWSKRFVDAMNDMQFVDRMTIDQVMMVGLYTIGATLKSTGLVIDINSPLAVALPPLSSGYVSGRMPIKTHDGSMSDEERTKAAIESRERTTVEVAATEMGADPQAVYDMTKPADIQRMACDMGNQFANGVLAVATALPLELGVLLYSYLFMPVMGGMTGAIGPAASKAIMDYAKGMVDAIKPVAEESALNGPAMAAFEKAIAPPPGAPTVAVVQQSDGQSGAFNMQDADEVRRLGHTIGRSWQGEIQALVDQMRPDMRQQFYAAAFAPCFGAMLRVTGLEPALELLQAAQRVLTDIDAMPPSPTKH